jgi:hypothetical protein
VPLVRSCKSTMNYVLTFTNGATFRITSRDYYNFTNDSQRKGDTIKTFTDTQSWDLLMKLLGSDWEDLDRQGLIKTSEMSAAKELLRDLGGVSLLKSK